MKRIAFALCVLLLIATTMLWAQMTHYTGGVVISLNAVSATGSGTTYGFDSNLAKFTWQSIINGGTATSISVNLECTLDGGTTFGVWDTSTSTTGEVRSVVNKPARGCRCNITSYTTNSTTATCQFVAAP